MTPDQILTLIGCLAWLMAGVGVFIVGMNLMGDGLEKCAGEGMKRMLEKITGNRFSGVAIGAGVTAIIQSSAATSIMAIGLVNAGVMTLMQAAPVIMGANIGTTVTGLLVALKNDYFNMAMYMLAFVGVMMGFVKKEKFKIVGSLLCGLGLIFVGLNIMSSEQAFGHELMRQQIINIFTPIKFPLLLILVGMIFTALIQSSSASTGIVITMVGTGILELELALFIILGANIGTCVTAMLASTGTHANAKRVATIHLVFNVIGTALFTVVLWAFKEPIINLLVALFPNDDIMSIQMRVSAFHVIFNVSTTLVLLPFVKQLVQLSCLIVKDKKTEEEEALTLKFVDERLLSTPSVALMQVKKEMDYMIGLVEENANLCLVSMTTGSGEHTDRIKTNEKIINFTNSALTKFLIKLSAGLEESSEKVVGAYFHVLNDLERIGDHAENFHEIGTEMAEKGFAFSDRAKAGIGQMHGNIMQMLNIAKTAFENGDKTQLPALAKIEDKVDGMKRDLIASHFNRLADGACSIEVSPYYSSVITGMERVGDHLINVGYSIMNPTGSQKDE